MKHIVILGAGISGLATAWFLHKKGVAITLIDKEPRVGGMIKTVKKKGFLFEQGPRGFRPQGLGQHTLRLVQELGLESKLIAADEKSRKRYLFLNHKLCAVTPFFLLRQGLFTAFLKEWKVPASSSEETIAHFFQRRCNKKFTNNVITPLIQGIFGGHAHLLSMPACLPVIWEWEKKFGSLSLALFKQKKEKKPPLYSFQGGMEELVQTLAHKLQVPLHLNAPVQSIERYQNKMIVNLKETSLEADLLISTLPHEALLPLFPQHLPLFQGFSSRPLTTVSFGYSNTVLKKKGYGFLMASKEEKHLLGMTWDSSIFPEHNQGIQTRICLMLRAEKKDVLTLALEAIARYLDLKKSPDTYLLDPSSPRIPQYTLGHLQRLSTLKKAFLHTHPQLRLSGSSFYGVGVNACVAQASSLALQVS